MEIRLADQTMAFLWALALGGGLGLFYDVFRITRIAFPTGKLLVFVQDIVFFFVAAAATFLYLMDAMHGKIRVFLLLGILLGWVAYYFTVGQMIMKVSKAIIEGIRRFLRFVWRRILYPIWRLVYQIVFFVLLPFRLLGQILKKTFIKAKFSLKVRRIVLYNQFTGPSGKKRGKRKAEEADGYGDGSGQAQG